MPTLQLRYSEAYDASISGWTGALDETFFNEHYDQWITDYVEPAKQYVTEVQAVWDEIDTSVFKAFRHFGFQFWSFWSAYAVHHWQGVVGFKDPLTFFAGDPMDEVIVLLIHELVHCHEDHPANLEIYEIAKDHIFQRFENEPIAVRYHLLTICVQWAVLQQVFPENYQKYIKISCQHPLLQRCAEILEDHQGIINYDDPLSSLLLM